MLDDAPDPAAADEGPDTAASADDAAESVDGRPASPTTHERGEDAASPSDAAHAPDGPAADSSPGDESAPEQSVRDVDAEAGDDGSVHPGSVDEGSAADEADDASATDESDADGSDDDGSADDSGAEEAPSDGEPGDEAPSQDDEPGDEQDPACTDEPTDNPATDGPDGPPAGVSAGRLPLTDGPGPGPGADEVETAECADNPSEDPSDDPSESPSEDPAEDPSDDPSEDPSESPSDDPNAGPGHDADEPADPPAPPAPRPGAVVRPSVPRPPATVGPVPGPVSAAAGPSARRSRYPVSLGRAGAAGPWRTGSGSGHGGAAWRRGAADHEAPAWPGLLRLPLIAPSVTALVEIPADMLARYQEAAERCPGLPWPVLAAVGKVESDHGRNPGVSSAGARGPMQFMPASWRAFGVDADGDGHARITDPDDAVHAAAVYLCAHGAGDPSRLRDAVFAYNHADWYVDRVLSHALRYAAADSLEDLTARQDVSWLAANPNLEVYPGGRADIVLGRIDPRVLDLLATLTAEHRITVTALRTGHSRFVAGTTTESHHHHGRAVDIAAIDGEPVTAASPRARALVAWLAAQSGWRRPAEVGSPFRDYAPLPGFFSDAAHTGHVHIGWREG